MISYMVMVTSYTTQFKLKSCVFGLPVMAFLLEKVVVFYSDLFLHLMALSIASCLILFGFPRI